MRIDLDRIRAQLPETNTYMRLNKRTAGLLTQMEAGAIAEIATEEAYKQGLHVWVDSSLRDAAQHAQSCRHGADPAGLSCRRAAPSGLSWPDAVWGP